MKIFIDADYCCHVDSGDGRRAIDVKFFDGKCRAFVEAYRFVPDGETWQRADGALFRGEMTSVCGDLPLAMIKQRQYEEDMAQAADMAAALEILGVTE